ADNAATVNVAEPLASASVTGDAASTLSDTSPVGMTKDEPTVTVTVPLAPYVTPGALTAAAVGTAPKATSSRMTELLAGPKPIKSKNNSAVVPAGTRLRSTEKRNTPG